MERLRGRDAHGRPVRRGISRQRERRACAGLNFDALLGRRLSSSYAPRAGQPRYDVLLAALHEPFDATQRDGHVSMDNDARIFVGTPVPS